ncbi:MAG: MotA/TolQ/ExbB proton channel family protein [Chitinispirillaceae bacterium]|jgi:biopolymer transport protein ExbB/TolQ|nr:MotA/TolQ/ExbB proton channel family protein [Chitinispirillaceae bacterium]
MLQFLAEWFTNGGVWMYPIAAISAFSIAIVCERLVFYYVKCRLNAKALMTQIVRLVRNDELDKARQLCAKTKSPLSVILESALWHYQQQEPDQEIQNAVDEVALRELPRIQRRTHYLSMFANISTLLGLLGTIFGLQEAFSSLSAADPSQKATLLSKGIAIGLNTTALGLIVAVPNMVLYSILGAKANTIIEEIDETSVRLLNFLYAQRRL